MFVAGEEGGAKGGWLDEGQGCEVGYVIAEGHWGRALEEGDGEGVGDGLGRGCGCGWGELGTGVVEGIVRGVVEGVGRCEGDGFGFDEVGEFENDGEVVEIWEIRGGGGGPSAVGDGTPDGRRGWRCRLSVGCCWTRCQVVRRWRSSVLS